MVPNLSPRHEVCVYNILHELHVCIEIESLWTNLHQSELAGAGGSCSSIHLPGTKLANTAVDRKHSYDLFSGLAICS